MKGYSGIPEFWLKPLQEIEPLNFEGTEMSLAKAYELSYKHALAVIASEGGKTEGDQITIPYKKPVAVAFEQNFENTYPIARERIDYSIRKDFTFSFKGNGYILYGNMVKRSKVDPDYIDKISKKFGSETFGLAELNDPYVAEVEIYIDGALDEKVYMPMKNTSRRLEPAWKYQLTEGDHEVMLKWINPTDDYEIRINDLIVYSEKPAVSPLKVE